MGWAGSSKNSWKNTIWSCKCCCGRLWVIVYNEWITFRDYPIVLQSVIYYYTCSYVCLERLFVASTKLFCFACYVLENCWLDFDNCHYRWCNIKALPGSNRLIKHLSGHRVPMALASNSPKENIETKLSFHQGILLFLKSMQCFHVLHG